MPGPPGGRKVLQDASRTDLPWAAQMAVIRGESRDKQRKLKDVVDEQSFPFHRATSAPVGSVPATIRRKASRKKVSPWQEVDSLKKSVFNGSFSVLDASVEADPDAKKVSPWQEVDSPRKPVFARAFSVLDASVADPEENFLRQDSRFVDSDCDCDERNKIILAEEASGHPFCGLFSYSMNGRPRAAPVPAWPEFPNCMTSTASEAQPAWTLQCGMQNTCWSEKHPVHEDLYSFQA